MGNTTSGYDESGHTSGSSSSSRRSSLANNQTATRNARSQTMNINNTVSSRQRRASSVVGSLLTGTSRAGSSFSRNYDFSNNTDMDTTRTGSSREKQVNKENHYRNLVVKYDECVDGGFLAPYGVHDDEKKLDYNDTTVRQLIIGRKLQPFYLPLEDYEENELSDEELLKILRSTLLHQPYPEDIEKFEDLPGVKNLSKAQLEDASNIDSYIDYSSSKSERKLKKSLIFAARLYKLKSIWQQDENERYLDAKNSFSANNMVSNDKLLLDLYRNGDECPICFLYLPKNFNYSRCCYQPICTECFVQIKRKEPHYQNSHDENELTASEDTIETLVSECAHCPYCATPDFGVIYEMSSSITKTGLGSGTLPSEYTVRTEEKIDSSDSLVQNRRRAQSIPANHKSVVTSDMIRPDWEANLSKAKLKLKKRFAKANTIHMNNRLISSDENDKMKLIEDEMIERAIRLSLAEQPQ
ncbi:hypothetical protein QEN19_000632 [Hanseniaspora menglaensis]